MSSNHKSSHAQWGSRVGFILAATGSAAVTYAGKPVALDQPFARLSVRDSLVVHAGLTSEQADSADADKIMNVLRTEKVDTTVGTIKFDARGDAEGVGFSMYQVQNGAYVELK